MTDIDATLIEEKSGTAIYALENEIVTTRKWQIGREKTSRHIAL
jgi:hypothetical protein